MSLGGTWEANTFLSLPSIKVGIAPLPLGSDGTRRLMANSNGNNMWAGTKNPEQTWKWMSYQESAACQAKAAEYNASFLPSIGSATDALVQHEAAKGQDLSVFADYVKQQRALPQPRLQQRRGHHQLCRAAVRGLLHEQGRQQHLRCHAGTGEDAARQAELATPAAERR